MSGPDDPRRFYADRDLRGGYDCIDHQWVEPGWCGICHEPEPGVPVETRALEQIEASLFNEDD